MELLVTKKHFLPAWRSLFRVSGMPGIKESPRQMTPSQSKMKISTWSSNCVGGSDSFKTLACKCVVEVWKWLLLAVLLRTEARGAKARAPASKSEEDTRERANFMVEMILSGLVQCLQMLLCCVQGWKKRERTFGRWRRLLQISSRGLLWELSNISLSLS